MDRVLEIGAGDYFFDYVKDSKNISWIKADFAALCDVICDFNSSGLTLPFAAGEIDLVVCTEVVREPLLASAVVKRNFKSFGLRGETPCECS